MTNDDIIKIALAIIVGIVSAFSKSLFDRILAEYKPDIKKMKSRLFFLVLILFRFIIPFIVLIVLYIKTENIDKVFIISFSTISFIFIFNIFYDIFVKYVDKKYYNQLKYQDRMLSLIETVIDKEKETKDNLSEVVKIIDRLVKITSDSIDKPST